MTPVHICRGVNIRYTARFRERGCRKCHVGKDRRTFRAALRDLTRAFEGPSAWAVGDVVMSADYYAPIQLLELRSFTYR
jgi:hypothetical protein